MDHKLLDILCCPTTKQPFSLLNQAELNALNQAIGTGNVVRADGSKQLNAIKEGLLTRDRKIIYRLEEGIPVLLADQAIATAALAELP